MELQNLLESASKDLKTLNELKNLAVKLGQYELGAECRRLEKELYPLVFDEVLVFYDKNIGNAKIIGTAKLATRGEFKLIDRVDIYRENKNENRGEDEENGIKKQERPWYHF